MSKPSTPVPNRTITIVDVAQEAAVSIRTVSRVLNGEPYVSEAKRVRVQEVIERLAFVPSASARALPGGRHYTLALLFERLSANYLVDFQFAAMRTCHENGYRLLVEELATEELRSRSDAAAALARLQIDGAVLLPPLCDNAVLLDALDAAGVRHSRVAPAIDIDRSSAITFDDAAATSAMVGHLHALGHRRIGFVVGNANHASAAVRLDAFHSALAKLDLVACKTLIRSGDYSYASGVEAGLALLSLPTPPTAVFASNDAMAAGVVAAAGMRGLTTPRDLSVCGFDDSPLSRHIWPPLTTIRQPLGDMSNAAIEQLLQPRRERLIAFSYELVARASTTRPGEDPDFGEANFRA
jgi:LacI family transcriptional regulator